METLSELRLTRSKARTSSHAAEKPFATQVKSKKKTDAMGERAPFCDLTNSDSPIAGVVPGKAHTASRLRRTPAKKGTGSPQQDGEEVLRSQVRALLEKQPSLSSPLLLELPTEDVASIYSPCSATKKAPTPANTPVGSSSGEAECEIRAEASVNKGIVEESPRALLLQAIEKLETENAEPAVDEDSSPTALQSITRTLWFDADASPDSPTALLVRTPVVAGRRLKSVVVVPSPEEATLGNDVEEDWSMLAASDSLKSALRKHQPQWSMEVNVSSPERYVPAAHVSILDRYVPDRCDEVDDQELEREGPAGPKEEAPTQVSSIPKMKIPLALGVFSPVPAPRVAWKHRHVAAADKPGPLFEDLPTVVLEGSRPKKAEGVPLSPKPPAGPKRNASGTTPLLRRALHNDSTKKQKEKNASPAKPAFKIAHEEFPVPAWTAPGSLTAESPTKETEHDPESIDEICDVMQSLHVDDGRILLHGLPTPQGSHVRFDADGEVEEIEEGDGKLKGLPTPQGLHTRFE